MLKIGITGQNGFVGTHLYNSLGFSPNEFERIDYDISFYGNEKELDRFVEQCDVIVHLAAMNRHKDPNVIYATNIELVEKLIASLERTKTNVHVLFSSSSQEEKENPYGKSKKEGRILFENWAKKTGGTFTGLIIPNVFGPFGKPLYNSVVATFSHQISHGEVPKIQVDGELKLIYVGELVLEILKKIKERKNESLFRVPHSSKARVSEV